MQEQRPVAGLPEDAETSADWRTVIAGLETDLAAVKAGREAVREERRGLALPIARGDAAAQKRNTALNAREVELMGREDVLGIALGEAAAKLAGAEAAEGAAEAAARRERLLAGKAAAERLAGEVDARLKGAADAFTAFREAVNAMVPDGLEGARVNKLRNRTKMLGALHAAGLGGHLALDRVAPSHQETLESWTRRILAGLVGEGAPADAAPVQVGPLPPPRPLPPAPAFDPAVRG